MNQSEQKSLPGRRAFLQAGAVAALAPIVANAAQDAPAWAMIIDLNRCIGCQSCTLACKALYDVPKKYRTRVSVSDNDEGRVAFLPVLCWQCENPACMSACPSRAFYKENGVVRVETKLCTGCGACEKACPFDAVFVDPRSQKAMKCNFCRSVSSSPPACVEACASHARLFGDLRHPDPAFAAALAQHPKSLAPPSTGSCQVLYIPLQHKEGKL